jgi:predicted GH43/DUF377 family glycosyl hydrolase
VFGVQRLNSGKPILVKVESNPWESKVVFNPGCVLVEGEDEVGEIVESMKPDKETLDKLRNHRALVFVVYRAQGMDEFKRSSLGLAIFTPDLKLIKRFPHPIVKPEEKFENLGVEDPRITKVGKSYFMFYTGYASGSEGNKINICIAETKDFVHWRKHGLLKGEINEVDNKNAVLFPEKINGKFVLLHRPMEGEKSMVIHYAISDDILGEWKDFGVLIDCEVKPGFVKSWNGAGAPPLKIDEKNFLMIYHIGNFKSDSTREYHLGIALIEKDDRSYIKLVKKFEPFLKPETEFETKGDEELGVNNVVFICGAYFYDDYLYFPYAGADSVILGGRVLKSEILNWARNKS